MAELTRYLVHDQDAYEDADGDYYRADELVAFLRELASYHEEADRPYHAYALNDFADTMEAKGTNDDTT